MGDFIGIFKKIRSILDRKYDISKAEAEEEMKKRIREEWKAEQELAKKTIANMENQEKETQERIKKMNKEAEVLFNRHSKWGLLTQQEINEKIDQPVLFLMRDDLSVDVIEGLVPGPLEIKNKKNLVAGHLFLNAKKLHIVKWGSGHLRAWFAYEREAVCYPTDIIFDSQTIVGEMLNLLMNMKTYAANKMPGGKYDWIFLAAGGIVLIVVAIGLLTMFGFSIDKLLHGSDAATTITTTVMNNTSKMG